MKTLTPKPRKQGRAVKRTKAEITSIIAPLIYRCGIDYQTLSDPTVRTEMVLTTRKAVIHAAACNGLSYKVIARVLNMGSKCVGDYDKDAAERFRHNTPFRLLVAAIADL
jgi:DNA-binding NarL/FixJ family response regulator